MSALSTRRIKDRGGGSGGSSIKAAALRSSKSLTPVSCPDKILGADGFSKLSYGKENRRSTSRGAAVASTQKPAIRPMSRVDKASLVAAGNSSEVLERKSTSSVPRGRSSGPSECIMVFPDIRRDRRVSVDRVAKGPIREGDRSVFSGGKSVRAANQTKGYKELNHKGSDDVFNGAKFLGEVNEEVTIKGGLHSEAKSGVNHRVWEKKVGASESERIKSLVKSRAVNVRENPQICDEMVNSERESKVLGGFKINGQKEESCSVEVGKIGNRIDSCLAECGEKSTADRKVLDISKEKGSGNECTTSAVGSKYPSRLHEKLSFLEGKVKRIASDIRKTKEMLDMNNPDSSKMILSDIQEKISGIEKAMGHVTSDSDAKLGLLKTNANDSQESNLADGSQSQKEDQGKFSVKELNNEELEARLFPHHKLLRNRTSSKALSGSCVSNEFSVTDPGLEQSKVEEKLLSPVDENSIALEFLASLNTEASKVTSWDGQADVKYCDVQETEGGTSAEIKVSSSTFNQKCDVELLLTTDEKLDEFDDQENKQSAFVAEEREDTLSYSLNEIGNKASTAGWFVSEGEAVLLAHDDGSCSFYDIANCEEKAVYTPPSGISPNIWRDCWMIRAPGSDGCSGRYVVAASAGNTIDSGFCSWDFYTKDVCAFQVETGTTASRRVLGPLPNNIVQRRNSASSILAAEASQWWYKPCGPLIISTASSQRTVKVFDVRDGEQIMKWEVPKPVITMDYSSPLQWRNRGKVVIAEAETISLWDVNSLTPQAMISVPSTGQKISALHVSNTDAELGGGVRQRVSSSEAEGNDGVFCTSDSVNILDFRQPSGVGLRISKLGVNALSVFSRGDSIFLGCTSSSSTGKKYHSSVLQQFSLRKQGLFSTYALPESNGHSYQSAISQVWGNANFVMGVCGLGLFVFDAVKDDALRAFSMDYTSSHNESEVIGPDDLYCPTFDYLGCRTLLISRDRPAMWRHLL